MTDLLDHSEEGSWRRHGKATKRGKRPFANSRRLIQCDRGEDLQTIDEGAKVSDAIAKMSRLGLRRLGVTKRGIIVGIITQKAVVTGNVEQNFPSA